MKGDIRLYKKRETDRIYWGRIDGYKGRHLFSFDGKTVYNLFKDYPHNLTREQKKIFDKENPFWANFFKE